MKSCASWLSSEGFETDVKRDGEGRYELADGARLLKRGSGEWECSGQSWRVTRRGPGLFTSVKNDSSKEGSTHSLSMVPMVRTLLLLNEL